MPPIGRVTPRRPTSNTSGKACLLPLPNHAKLAMECGRLWLRKPIQPVLVVCAAQDAASRQCTLNAISVPKEVFRQWAVMLRDGVGGNSSYNPCRATVMGFAHNASWSAWQGLFQAWHIASWELCLQRWTLVLGTLEVSLPADLTYLAIGVVSCLHNDQR